MIMTYICLNLFGESKVVYLMNCTSILPFFFNENMHIKILNF